MLKTYYFAKIIRKLRLSSFKNCDFDRTARASVGCSFSNVKMGRYSYTGAGCHITDAVIGNFCSIGGGCGIGGGMHPLGYVSTSPVFLKGRNIMKTNFVELQYIASEPVYIGNDVWIGDGVFIKAGIHIGNGAIIGAHAVVVKDVEPYSIVAGVPAKEIRKRFDEETIQKLLDMKWWEWPDEKLRKNGPFFDDPKKLIIETMEQ